MKISLKIFLVVWAIFIALGTIWITDYASRPNRSANAPAELQIQIDEKLPKLFVFLSPQCPCSRATLTELARLIEKNPRLFETQIYFYQPSDAPIDWSENKLWQKAAEISGAKVKKINEAELKKFDARTSGQTLFYHADGRLLFSGGITQSRGHEGENIGIYSIESYLRNGRFTVSQTPVFGCILISE